MQEDFEDPKTLDKLVRAMAGPFRLRGRIGADNVSTLFADETPLLSLSKDGATVATSVNSYDREQGMEGTVYGTIVKPTAAQMLKSMTALLVSAAGAVASITSFIFAPAIIVYVAGGICIMNFPMVSYKEKKILMLPSRKKAVDNLHDMAEILKSEADVLQKEIEYMSGCAAGFGDIEQELQEVAQAQGSDVDKLVELVRLNEETMDLMKENLRQKVIQDVIGIIMRNSKDISQRIDRVEAKLLALKITVKLESYGVTFNEDKFLQAVSLNPTPWGVVVTVRKLLPPNEGIDDDSIASDKDDIYDMFYISDQRSVSALAGRVGSEGLRGSLASRRQSSSSFIDRSPTRQGPSSRV